MIYWDHNAQAPLRPEVASLLARAAQEGGLGNPSSVHRAGQKAKERLEDARRRVAAALGVRPKEVVFTASGTEGNALCLKGGFAARTDPARRRIVTSQIEHPSVLGAVAQLQPEAEVVRLPPNRHGRISEAALQNALDDRVALCSLMWANNETGVLQPVEEAARLCKERGVLFHTDAVQVTGKVPVDLSSLAPDLVTLSAHKFGGPAGAGACIVREEVALAPLTPGHQEDGRRGGTPNVIYAEALALALELSLQETAAIGAKQAALRDRFERSLLERFPDAAINGGGAERIPNTSNVRFHGVDGEALLIALDLEGICASLGAACASGSLSPSHVLMAAGLSVQDAKSSLRFSFGPSVDDGEVDAVLRALALLVRRCKI